VCAAYSKQFLPLQSASFDFLSQKVEPLAFWADASHIGSSSMRCHGCNRDFLAGRQRQAARQVDPEMNAVAGERLQRVRLIGRDIVLPQSRLVRIAIGAPAFCRCSASG
jgi:hypothetical protein